MKKHIYLYGSIIALSFLWTGSAYISLFYRMIDYYTSSQLDIYHVVIGYLLQALGMILFAWGVHRRSDVFTKKSFFFVIMIFEAVIISLGLLSQSPSILLFSSLVMNLLHGFVAGFYLLLLSKYIPQQYRGRAFGFAYAIGSIGSWILSLPFDGEFLKMEGILIVYIVLIMITIVLNTKISEEEIIFENPSYGIDFNFTTFIHIFVVLILLSLIKNIGFYFPVSDISTVINIEFSRAFYAIGLIAAGVINDKNRRYGAVCCLASLLFAFISFSLLGKTEYTVALWILGYIFFGFFSVYRVIVFSDIAAKKTAFLVFAGSGLIAGRIGDALGTIVGILLSKNIIALLIVTSSLFIIVIFMFFYLYHKLYIPVLSDNQKLNRIYEIFTNSYQLTTRESEVLHLIVEGYTNSEISSALYIAESTVKFHVGNIFKKTHCSSRTQLGLLFKEKLNQLL